MLNSVHVFIHEKKPIYNIKNVLQICQRWRVHQKNVVGLAHCWPTIGPGGSHFDHRRVGLERDWNNWSTLFIPKHTLSLLSSLPFQISRFCSTIWHVIFKNSKIQNFLEWWYLEKWIEHLNGTFVWLRINQLRFN